ncbi:hypothetical protein [Lactobacillus sp. Sy-1]|uniref:hypothetical protein n=1 Tax=Lactobacillus sp. Sy-1 TaxID=2109645 RepID=UPI001C55B2CE|nr:hypothetical protein [Lactobacillus sp. Sy-1]MBW1605176.1 hypothetical protein [Lactobacillus sp. Sy-1]
MNKGLGYSILLTALLGSSLLSSQNQVANAATWHKGLPSIVTSSKTWVTDKKEHSGYTIKGAYRRYLIFTTKKSMIYSTMGFYKNGSSLKSAAARGDAEGQILTPQYQKLSKNTYLIKNRKTILGEHVSYKVTKHGKKINVTIKDNYGYHMKHGKNFGLMSPDKNFKESANEDPLKY